MYCRQCGKSLDDNQKFCMNCGAPTNNTVPNQNVQKKTIQIGGKEIGEKEKKILIIVGIIIVIMALISIAKEQREKQENEIVENKVVEVSNGENTVEQKKDVEQSELMQNMTKAMGAIQIDASKIKDLEQKPDWNGGPLYTFLYKQNRFYVYVNQDKTISSIRIGLLGKNLYQEGYAPLNVNDYIVDNSIATELQVKIQPYVESYLNYPKTADFPLVDGWGYSRVKDVYGISGYVEAQNAFGVEDKVNFYGEFQISGNSYKLVYLTVDGTKRVGSESKMVDEEMQELATEKSTDGKILLNDGIKGEYGKTVNISNYEYIKYYVPTGKYEIIPKTKNALVFLDDVKTTRNSDGYEESITYKTYRFATNPEDNIIEVKKNHCISLGVGTKVELVPIN